MKIIALSDTHGKESKIQTENCDILIHAGDCDINTLEDLERLNAWFGKQPAKKKIFVAGNHDFYCEKLQPEMIQEILNNAYYLMNHSIIINGLKIWGSPYSPKFGNWAFMATNDWLSDFIWSKIPKDVDILVTHSPAWGILDYTKTGAYVGCPGLRNKFKYISPMLHICGHIHES